MLYGRFRRSAVPWLALIVALGSGGCVQLEQKLLLNGDGSLAISFHYSVAEDSEGVLSTGARVIQQWQGRPAGSPAWITSEEAVRQQFAATGVQVQKYSSYAKGGRRHIEILLFAEYGPAALNSGLLGPLRCSRLPDGALRLWADLPAAPQKAAGLDEKALVALAQDLYLRLELSVPGEIATTTAPTRGRNTAIWILDPGKDPSFLREVPPLECSFEAKGLDWAERVPLAAAP